MKQYEQVIEVMKQNGGFATLGFINHNTNVSDWKTNTPFASIRRIVQDERFFFKIKPGLWALNSYKEEVLSKFNLLDSKSIDLQEEFNHSYYQGLLAEIGNARGLSTYVPNQDKNKPFLGKPLKDVTNIGNIFEFSYPEIIRRAKTVDVIWFNERKLPTTFFEVEHSTDFQNSFSKFSDLQDFYSDFFIISSEKRKKEFEHKINFSSFQAIKPRVKFMDYDFLASLHTKTFEYQKFNKIFN